MNYINLWIFIGGRCRFNDLHHRPADRVRRHRSDVQGPEEFERDGGGEQSVEVSTAYRTLLWGAICYSISDVCFSCDSTFSLLLINRATVESLHIMKAPYSLPNFPGLYAPALPLWFSFKHCK